MSKKVSEFFGCPIARDCKNDKCLMRMVKVFGYDPSPKAINADANKHIEQKCGKGFVPKFEQRTRWDHTEFYCHDYKNR